MKRSYSLLLIILLFSFCKKQEEQPAPLSEADNAPGLINEVYIKNVVYINSNTAFALPVIAFNFQKEKPISMSYIPYTFMPILDSVKILSGAKDITFDTLWNKNGDSLKILAKEKLDLNTNCRLIIKTHWKWKNVNEWIDYKKNGQTVYERKEYQFFTGNGKKDTLSNENILFTYPIEKQYNFYQREYSNGFLNFRVSERDNFPSESKYKYLARFIGADKTVEADVSYLENDKKIIFNIPELQNAAVYKLQIIRKDQNEEQILKTINFRTSKYNSFEEKINSIKFETKAVGVGVVTAVAHAKVNYISDEGFDKFEQHLELHTKYTYYVNGLVELKLDSSNVWIRALNKNLYDGYKKSKFIIS